MQLVASNVAQSIVTSSLDTVSRKHERIRMGSIQKCLSVIVVKTAAGRKGKQPTEIQRREAFPPKVQIEPIRPGRKGWKEYGLLLRSEHNVEPNDTAVRELCYDMVFAHGFAGVLLVLPFVVCRNDFDKTYVGIP